MAELPATMRLVLQIFVVIACATAGFTLGRGAPANAPAEPAASEAPGARPDAVTPEEGPNDMGLAALSDPVEERSVALAPVVDAADPALTAALTVDLRETFLERVPESAFVALAPAGGDPPRTGDDVRTEARVFQRLEGTARFVLDEVPTGKEWLVVAGRSFTSRVVTAPLAEETRDEPIELALPAKSSSDLLELVVRGPSGAVAPAFRVTNSRGRTLPLFTRTDDEGRLRTWTTRAPLFKPGQDSARVIVEVLGAGAQCLLLDSSARTLTANFAEPGEVLVQVSGSDDRRYQVELRPGAPRSSRGFFRTGLLDLAEARAGETVRFGGLQPGRYLVTARPAESVEAYSSLYQGVAEVPVELQGPRASVPLALPVLHEVLVRADDATSDGFVELTGKAKTSAGEVDVFEREWFVRGPLVRFADVPAGTYQLQLRDRDPITLEVPMADPVVEVSFAD